MTELCAGHSGLAGTDQGVSHGHSWQWGSDATKGPCRGYLYARSPQLGAIHDAA